MTLQEAEADKRFEQFKFCTMIELAKYITKCNIFLAKNPDDKEVAEFKEGAMLIHNERCKL